jgi:hypothetical protein
MDKKSEVISANLRRKFLKKLTKRHFVWQTQVIQADRSEGCVILYQQ